MKFQRHSLLLLCWAALCAGHAGLHRRASSDTALSQRLAGVRRCLALHAGDEMEVSALKQRYGNEPFLVARPAGSPKLVAKAALHATYEALLRGSGCVDAADQSSTAWFLDVGTDDDELLALASSLGCGVSVLDPEVKDIRAVDMTRCMNEEPNRPFVIFQVAANNVTNPETLANMTRPLEGSIAVNVSAHPQKKSLIAWGGAKPTMLNYARKKRAQEKKKNLLNEKPAVEAEQAEVVVEASVDNKTAPVEEVVVVPEPAEPMESGVMLDTVFTKAGANASEAAEVKGPSGVEAIVNKISVLKITPRSESAATLKALQGARGLLESGRVQCLVTEMNFDLNHTEALLNFVVDLEKLGFHFAHLGSLDYSELEVTDQGQYEVFRTDSKQLQELFDTYKRIRSFDERSGFRVYSGSLSLDRKGHYFDYTDTVFACKNDFPSRLSVLEKGKIRFRNGVWWLEKSK